MKARSAAISPQNNISQFTELYVWGNDEYGQLGLGHKYIDKKDQNIEQVHREKKQLAYPKSCSF